MSTSIADSAIAVFLARLVIAIIVLLLASSLVNWAVINHHLDHSLGRLALYFPLVLGLGLAVLRKPAPGIIWLLVGFALVILLSFVHAVGAGSRGFIVASCYFLILGQLIGGFRLQRYAAKLSLLLVILMVVGLIYELLWAGLPVGFLSVSPGRSALFYMNPNLAALGLCLLAFSAANILHRSAQCLLWVAVFFAVVATGSRSTIVALLVVCMAWVLFEWRLLINIFKRYRILACLLLFGGGAGILSVYETSSDFQSVANRSLNMVNFARDDYSEYFVRRQSVDDDPYLDEMGHPVLSRFVRTRLLVRAWDVYWLSPVFGHGLDRAHAIVPHNIYIFWPVALGVLGWLVLPLLLLWLWCSSGSYYEEEDWGAVPSSDSNLVRKLLAVFLAVIALFLHDLFMNSSLMVAFSLAVFSSQKELIGVVASDNGD